MDISSYRREVGNLVERLRPIPHVLMRSIMSRLPEVSERLSHRVGKTECAHLDVNHVREANRFMISRFGQDGSFEVNSELIRMLHRHLLGIFMNRTPIRSAVTEYLTMKYEESLQLQGSAV